MNGSFRRFALVILALAASIVGGLAIGGCSPAESGTSAGQFSSPKAAERFTPVAPPSGQGAKPTGQPGRGR